MRGMAICRIDQAWARHPVDTRSNNPPRPPSAPHPPPPPPPRPPSARRARSQSAREGGYGSAASVPSTPAPSTPNARGRGGRSAGGRGMGWLVAGGVRCSSVLFLFGGMQVGLPQLVLSIGLIQMVEPQAAQNGICLSKQSAPSFGFGRCSNFHFCFWGSFP